MNTQESGPRRQRAAAYGVALDGAGAVLLVHGIRGKWYLPGGGIRHGEHPTDALQREFGEETGLSVLIDSLVTVISDLVTQDGVTWHSIRLVYRVTVSGGILRAEIGGSTAEPRWVAMHAARELPLMPFVADVLADMAGPLRP